VAESEELLCTLDDADSFEANLMLLAQGLLALIAGDFDRAAGQFDTSLALGQALDAKAILSVTCAGLGEVAMAQGRVTDAADHYRDGVIQGWDGDYALGIVWNVHGLVRVGIRRGGRKAMARLIGASAAFQGAIRALPGAAVGAYEADIAMVRAALGDEAFSEAQEARQALSVAEVVAMAIALTDAVREAHT